VDRIREYVPLENAAVLLEHTGHYHLALEQYLLELDITVYRIHVQKRPKGMLKTDKRDALGLANTQYSQVALGVQVADKMQLVRPAVPPTKAAAQLRGLIQHRYELVRESTQRSNKLTSICDELIPEFTQIFRDPNLPSALAFRETFPTPHAIATNCHEGHILLSIPQIGPMQAATIIATIGHISNFEKASELKSYFGWAPKWEQTGTTFDRTNLAKGGARPMKHMLFLMAARAISIDGEWAKMYQQLLPRMCSYDERRKDYRGKLKVLGRIAGQMASMIFALLTTDQETLSKVPPGQEPPPPMLYDPEVHRRHREGNYRPLKPGTQPRKIIQLPKKS
jgi:transposase